LIKCDGHDCRSLHSGCKNGSVADVEGWRDLLCSDELRREQQARLPRRQNPRKYRRVVHCMSRFAPQKNICARQPGIVLQARRSLAEMPSHLGGWSFLLLELLRFCLLRASSRRPDSSLSPGTIILPATKQAARANGSAIPLEPCASGRALGAYQIQKRFLLGRRLIRQQPFWIQPDRVYQLGFSSVKRSAFSS